MKIQDLFTVLIIVALFVLVGLLTNNDKEMEECLKINSEATCNYHLNR